MKTKGDPDGSTPVLLTNGRIYTLDARDSIVDTLVIRGGRVVFAGHRHEINPPAGEPIVARRRASRTSSPS